MTEHEYTADEFLDWLCWMWAQEGERFYPPDETAAECTDHLVFSNDGHEWSMVYENEFGKHCRAYTEAVNKFEAAESWGFDPVMRAEREHADLQERGEGEIPDIDWSWWTE